MFFGKRTKAEKSSLSADHGAEASNRCVTDPELTSTALHKQNISFADKLRKAADGVVTFLCGKKSEKALPIRIGNGLLSLTALVLTAAAAFHIGHIAASDLQLVMLVGNRPVGAVDDIRMAETLVPELEQQLSAELGTAYTFPYDITFRPGYYDAAALDEESCMELLKARCSEDLVFAHVLKIDGIFVAANKSSEDLENVIGEFEQYRLQTLSGRDDAFTQVKLTNSVEIEQRLCAKSQLKSYEEIFHILVTSLSASDMAEVLPKDHDNQVTTFIEAPTQSGSLADRANTGAVSSTVSSTYSTAINEAALDDGASADPAQSGADRVTSITMSSALSGLSHINTNVEYGVNRFLTTSTKTETAPETEANSAEEAINLAFMTTKIVTLEEAVPYPIEYQDDPTRFTDHQEILSFGSDGQRRVTYEIQYNGEEEYSRTELASRVLTEPIPQVVLRGTKPIPAYGPTGGFIWPLSGPIASEYGSRTLFGTYDFHLGLDIDGTTGDSIVAADGGTVITAGDKGSYGLLVIVDHGNGIKSYYAHMDRIDVKVGDVLYQGQQIGVVGKTGVATGDHLHFEIRFNNRTVNPRNYLPKK